MKILTLVVILFSTILSFGQTNTYKVGEELTYCVHYGFIDAGVVTFSIKDDDRKFYNHSTYHVVGTAISNSTFDLFFKMRDYYETYIDKQCLDPWFFYRKIEEDGYKFSESHLFNLSNNTVTNKNIIYTTPANVQDMFSILYYARTLDLNNAKVGDLFSLPYFMTDKNYEMKIKYMGKENIKIGLGKFTCLKFRPMVEKGRVFKEEEDVTMWISDDKNHVPIRVQANVLVGSVKCDLLSYSGLANEFIIIK